MDEFVPLRWQQKVMDDTSESLLLVTGTGGGKTRVCNEKVHKYCVENKNAVALVLTKKTNRAYQDYVFETSYRNGGNVSRSISRNTFEYQNGSIVYFGHMPRDIEYEGLYPPTIEQDPHYQDPQGWQALNADIVLMDDAQHCTYYNFIRAQLRLRNNAGKYRQIMVAALPPFGAFYDETNILTVLRKTVNSYYNPFLEENFHLPKSYVDVIRKVKWGE